MRKIDDFLEKMLTESGAVANDRVPYAFEKRVMAHIKETPKLTLSIWGQWSQSLWRAVVPCFAILILAALWTDSDPINNRPDQIAPAQTIAQSDDDTREDLESIVMFVIDSANTNQ
ncbi:MAG: hypothetical protein P8M70_08825 [Verrucomicrobiota bacterium]|nr:hypothetical protein [Verrucomicrobiota bacterium]